MLHPQETREDLDIRFWIHRVVDDLTENQKGWSFLRHPNQYEGENRIGFCPNPGLAR